MSKTLKSFFLLYVFGATALFLYSFTQVDLSLTLSQASIWQEIQKSFQQIGYFQRPLSSYLFIGILSILFLSYLGILFLAFKKKISLKHLWILIIATSAILVFSYNAFSYDLFNYIFDAKTITYYGQNPYEHKALDFPNDPMLSFMRWTHRLYPYGPLWLGITVPVSFLGMNFFLLTFFMFKGLLAAFYLGTVYFIQRVLKESKSDHIVFSVALFALNPLVIIESLVSSHNDIAMMFFAVFGLYLYLLRKKALSVGVIIASYLIKSVTIFLVLPILIDLVARKLKQNISRENLFRLCVLAMTTGLIYVLTKLEIQPWYALWILPFVCLLRPNRFIVSETIFVSIGLLLTYFPYIATGSYEGILAYKTQILLISAIFGIIPPLLFPVLAKNKLQP